MSLFLTVVLLSLAFSVDYSESKNQKRLLSAVLVGTVYCDDSCFPKASPVIEGASVAVECKNTRWVSSFQQQVKTDNHGEFKVHLPFFGNKSVKKIRGCSVMLISSNDPSCALPATSASTTLNLKSRQGSTHIFSAGFFTFKRSNQPQACDRNPRIRDFKKRSLVSEKSSVLNPNNNPAFLPPGLGQLPPLPLLPRLPPLPQLPRLPTLPGIPYLPPEPRKETAIKSPKLSDELEMINQPEAIPFIFPPNPLNPPSIFPPNPLNPPSIFPPNPFQPPPALLPPVVPSPPSSIFPPLFPAPPATVFPPVFTPPKPPPFFNLPPIPGFTPSSPPPPPTFPISFPPFPFQPTPGFPGVPPADASGSP